MSDTPSGTPPTEPLPPVQPSSDAPDLPTAPVSTSTSTTSLTREPAPVPDKGAAAGFRRVLERAHAHHDFAGARLDVGIDPVDLASGH